ncbi:hypothetical protein HMPREF1986_00367 [Oribacterium sp. oral taxon 078 str. F0263]|uniref:hypothetical protein n=1 Tax=Oribacterium sp. oral taxon 078 TaxID=652706 RepID=UPI0003AE6E0C|nr:hypothetical protein [Oribacterium sp. oral taxon 078]ERL22755.1 hypothetical protein HMPREF1986_00367 [Oribacterium sp. oral taxon 078 str. F0263]
MQRRGGKENYRDCHGSPGKRRIGLPHKKAVRQADIFGCVFGSVLFRISTFLFPPFSIKDVEEGQKTKSQGKLKKEKPASGRTEAEKKRDEKERNADDQIDDPILTVVSFEIENPDKDQEKTDQCGKEIIAQCPHLPTGP